MCRACAAFLTLLTLAWCVYLASGADAACARLTRETLFNVLDRQSIQYDNDESPTVSFIYFLELIERASVAFCWETLSHLGEPALGVQSLLVVPDEAFRTISVNMNRTLDEIMEDSQTVCDILEASIIHGTISNFPLDENGMLETALSLRSSIPSNVRVGMLQVDNSREVGLYDQLGAHASVLASDIMLCQFLYVSILSEMLSYRAVLPDISTIARSLADLHITSEAIKLTEALRIDFEREEYGYGSIVNGIEMASSISSCTDANAKRLYALPSNMAWIKFFRRYRLSRRQVFADRALLLSILLYAEMEKMNSTSTSMMSYMTHSLGSGDIFRPSGASTFLSAIPGQIEAFPLRLDVDIDPFRRRILKFSGVGTSTYLENSALSVVTDIMSCRGIVHIVENVLVPPTLTSFRQVAIRGELSMFANMLRAPINKELLLELDTPSKSNIFVDGAILAPTNTAVRLTLNYLGIQFSELFAAEKESLLQQLVAYHVIGTRSTGQERLAFRVGLLAPEQSLATKLWYPILEKPSNTFRGVPTAKNIKIVRQMSTKRFSSQMTPELLVQGRLNAAKLRELDIPSTNGPLSTLDELLIPPTAEFGLSLYDRVQRATELRIFKEIIDALGLRAELRGQGFGDGDSVVFAPNNGAWLALFAQWTLPKDMAIRSRNAMLYDIIMQIISPRNERFQPAASEIYRPWRAETSRHGDYLPSALGSYVAEDSDLVFNWNSICMESNCTASSRQALAPKISGPLLEPGNPLRYNFAGIIAPNMMDGQRALNGELYTISTVLLPKFGQRCRTADFTYRHGYALELTQGRVTSFSKCDQLPCSYTLSDLYQRVGARISAEIVVTYDALPICDPWCVLINWWWCLPCTGLVAQTIATIGGCAPYQQSCGGALTVFVTDSGEIRFGAQTYMESYSNLPLSSGGGLRLVDVSVPGKGFTANDGETFKILCTYDGMSNSTKIYINDKLRGIADPYLMGQYMFQPFYNISGNLHEKITLGDGVHQDHTTRYANVSEHLENFRISFQDYPTDYTAGDRTFPAHGRYATYSADPLYEGRAPPTFFVPWRGEIHEAYFYFDNEKYQGMRYPSTCKHLEPLEPVHGDFDDFET